MVSFSPMRSSDQDEERIGVKLTVAKKFNICAMSLILNSLSIDIANYIINIYIYIYMLVTPLDFTAE